MSDKITREGHHWIFVTGENGGIIKTQDVSAHIQLAILEKLEELQCGLIDIESAIERRG